MMHMSMNSNPFARNLVCPQILLFEELSDDRDFVKEGDVAGCKMVDVIKLVRA